MMNGTKRIRTLTELELNSPATVARMKLDAKEADRLADLGMRTRRRSWWPCSTLASP